MRFRTRIGAILGAVAILTSDASAQSCASTLGATWDPATSTLSLSLSGAPANAPTMSFASFSQATTTMHGITLGLGMPFYTMLFGTTDANGNLAATRTLASAPSGVTAYFQSISMVMNGTGSGGMGGGGMGGGGMGGGGMGGMGGGGMGGTGTHGMTFCMSNVAALLFP